MPDGKVVYEVETDDSKAITGIKKTEEKIKKSSQDAANAQIQDNKEVTADAKSSSGKISTAFSSTFDKIKSNSGSLKDIVTGSFDEIASNIGLSADTLAKAGIIGGIAAVGTASVGMAANYETAINKFATQTGIAKEEISDFENVLKDIYANNYGESIDDVADAAARVKQQFDDIDAKGLQSLTENALTLRDAFDMDLNETLRGTDQLMTQFGLTAEQAMDLMASGAQQGLNYTDELGDNVAEYAGKFAQAGYSADEYFQLLKNGTQGGAYNLDKINDAINEVTTRLADGTIEDSLTKFSSDTQNVFKAWQNGEATQKEVIDSIVNDIRSCTNEQEKLTMAATAFGTMGEDANAKFVESLTSVGEGFEDVGGTMNDVKNTMSGGLSAQFEKLKRNVEKLLVPLGNLLIPVLNTIISVLSGIINVFAEVSAALFGWLGDTDSVIASIKGIWDALSSWWGDMWSAAFSLFESVWNSISSFITTIVEYIVNFLSDKFSGAVNNIFSIFQTFFENIKNIFDAILQLFSGIIDFLIGVFSGDWEKAWEGIKEIFSGVWNTLSSIVAGVWDTILSLFSNGGKIFSGVVDGIANVFKNIVNCILDGVNKVIRLPFDAINGLLNKIRSIDIPIIGQPFLGLWSKNPLPVPQIPRLKVGMDFVPNDYFPAYLDYGEAVLTREENAKLRSLGGIQGIENLFHGNAFMNQTLAIDYDRLAAAMANVGIFMDGKQVGYMTTNGVDQNMGLITNRKGRFGV